MAYPELPHNRLIITPVDAQGTPSGSAIDLAEEYGMVLLDGYSIKPSEPKTYYVDVPGRNGKLDLTQALTGDIFYDNSEMEFTFIIIKPTTPIEQLKREMAELLNGVKYRFTTTMDPGINYIGRFKITEMSHQVYNIGYILSIKITVNAEPLTTT